MISRLRCYILAVILAATLINETQSCFRSNEDQLYSIKIGHSFYQECQCTEPGYTSKNLVWLNPNNQPIGAQGPGTDVYTEDQGDSVNIHIPIVRKSMSGTYKCVTKVAGVVYTQTYTIDAYDPLYFYNTSTNQVLTYGYDGVIICEARGKNSPVLKWKKGEREIDEIKDRDKYVITPEGLLVRNVTHEDTGLYTCTAFVPSTSEEVDIFIQVKLITVPHIKTLKASSEITVAGEYLSIECIAEGIPHPEYFWNKTLEVGMNVSTNFTWRQEINTIIFENVAPSDRGTYECYAYNTAGYSKKNISIEVLVPPVITDFPNITEVEGSRIHIFCNATGRPDPTIVITHQINDLDSNHDLLEYEMFEGNSIFVDLDRFHEGVYSCNATNEVGSVENEMYLTVLHKPYFDDNNETLWGWAGKSLNLSCVPDSNPPATISWRFQGNEVLTDKQVQVNKELLQRLNTMTGYYLTLNIDNHTSYGVYECKAKNVFGENFKLINLQQGFKPPSIKWASVTDYTATSATFNIVGPDNIVGPPIIGYIAQYDEAQNFNITDIHINRTWSIDRPFRLDKLKPNTTYYVIFAPVNEVGTGPWSEYTLEFDTMDKSVPEPPVWESNALSLSNEGHVLKWKIPDDNGEPIDHLTLKYCPDYAEELCQVQRLEPTSEFKVPDLEYNRTYSFELQAHNAIGYSISSNITLTVAPPVLEAPSQLLSSEMIIGISVAAIVICLLLLDILFLVWRRQGVIASCCLKKDTKRKGTAINPRDKKGLLSNGESTEDPRRPNNSHKEYEYNKNTGAVTGKHSAV